MTATAADVEPSMIRMGPRVLVVEDEPQVRDHLIRLLVAAGFAVDGTSLRAEAVNLLRRGEPYQAVLVDLGLEDSSGVDTLRRIRAACPLETILCVITGQVGADEGILALELCEAGAIRIWVKPYNTPRMLQELRCAIAYQRGRAHSDPLILISASSGRWGVLFEEQNALLVEAIDAIAAASAASPPVAPKPAPVAVEPAPTLVPPVAPAEEDDTGARALWIRSVFTPERVDKILEIIKILLLLAAAIGGFWNLK